MPFAKREMSGGQAHAAREASGWKRRLVRNLAVALAAGLFLSFMGAMETMDWPLTRRLLYWIPLMMMLTPIGMVADLLAPRLPAPLQPPAIMWGVMSLGLAVPITLFVWLYTSAFNGWAPNPAALPVFFGATLTITLAMTGIGVLMEHPGALTHAQPAPTPGAPPSQARFLERLPGKLMGGTLYAVKAEDHYLRLYTSKGEDLILMRLADALAELEGLEGAQTHRSWWVAKEAVQEVKRAEGKVSLMLTGGIEAPVSRANVKPLREEGWL